MKCPRCSTETNITVAKREYIYPELFFGLPTFWRFMSPLMARAVTAFILVICLALAAVALVWLSQNLWLLGLFAGLIALLSLYVFVACVKALGKHQLKEYYKCNACGLEWSGQ
ncbi:hypothetical protein TFLX_04647 [Thermoflexales bacterium]|nr:hypothetical protein TFLX_04647 [Thermoflexales bacterium]